MCQAKELSAYLRKKRAELQAEKEKVVAEIRRASDDAIARVRQAARRKRLGPEGAEDEEELPLMTASPNLLREMQEFFLTGCSTIHIQEEPEETKEERVKEAKN